MMGSLAAQDALFYEFSLEDHIPQNHMVRKLDALLDFRNLRTELAPYYSHTGRPSIDPAAQWTASLNKPVSFAYSTNYLIDSKHAIIMDVEASRAIRQAEVTATNRMIERVKRCHGITPKKLAADTAYGSAENLHRLVEDKEIDPYIPVFDKSERQDGTFSRSDFTWDEDTNTYRCPGGKTLKTTGRAYEGKTRLLWPQRKTAMPGPETEMLPQYPMPQSATQHL